MVLRPWMWFLMSWFVDSLLALWVLPELNHIFSFWTCGQFKYVFEILSDKFMINEIQKYGTFNSFLSSLHLGLFFSLWLPVPYPEMSGFNAMVVYGHVQGRCISADRWRLGKLRWLVDGSRDDMLKAQITYYLMNKSLCIWRLVSGLWFGRFARHGSFSTPTKSWIYCWNSLDLDELQCHNWGIQFPFFCEWSRRNVKHIFGDLWLVTGFVA